MMPGRVREELCRAISMGPAITIKRWLAPSKTRKMIIAEYGIEKDCSADKIAAENIPNMNILLMPNLGLKIPPTTPKRSPTKPTQEIKNPNATSLTA